MKILVDGSPSLSENIEKVLRLNPHIEYLYFLPSEMCSGFDTVTGLCAPRTTKNYEVALFLENGGYAVIDDIKYEIHKGDIRFLRPGQTLYSKKFGDFFSLHFSLSADDADIDNEFLNDIPTFMPSYNIKTYTNLFKELIMAGSGDTLEDALLMKYKMQKLLYNLHISTNNYKKTAGLNEKNRTVIDKAIEFFEKHLSEDVGLEQISEHVNLHPVYFNRVFSKAIGIPPMNYFRKVRLNKAKGLLLTTNLKIISIAKMCGFSSSSYFIVQFRKEFGLTPSEYRSANSDEFGFN